MIYFSDAVRVRTFLLLKSHRRCSDQHTCFVKAILEELSVNHTTVLDRKLDPNNTRISKRYFLVVSKGHKATSLSEKISFEILGSLINLLHLAMELSFIHVFPHCGRTG